MLYVVGESLPKTDFLTKIDQVTVLSTCMMAVIGTLARVLAWIHDNYGDEVANDWNRWSEFSGETVYVLANLYIFLPTWYKRNSNVKRLKNR